MSTAAQQTSAPAALTWALGYVRRGWHVLPVGRDKRPLGGNGLASATTDGATLRKWWHAWPDADVAIACKASRLVVVDCDRGHDAGVDGVATFDAEAGGNPIGAALVACTPAGGCHYYFAAPADGEVRSRTVLAGVDVKAGGGEHGGYVIAPSGRDGRQWTAGDPLEDELAPPPAWLLQLLQRSENVAAALPSLPQPELMEREVSSALFAIPPTLKRGAGWLRAIFAVHAYCGGNEFGAQLVEMWSSQSKLVKTDGKRQYKHGEATGIYEGATGPEYAKDYELVDTGTLFALARRYGWRAAGKLDEVELVIGGAKAAAASTSTPPKVETPSKDDDHEIITVLSDDDVAKMPPVEWQIEGLLPEKSLAVIAGAPGAGKSFLMIDLMHRVVYGMPFLGRRTEPGSVIYLAGEGHAGIAGRINAWRSQNDVSAADRGGRYMAILDGIPTLSKKTANAVRKIVRETAELYGGNPSLVVVDTLSQGLEDGDENDAKVVSPAMRILSSIRKRHGCTVKVVHHLAKGKPGAPDPEVTLASVRGSGAVTGNVDTVLGVQRSGSQRSVLTLKQKDGEEAEPVPFELLPVKTGRQRRDGSPETSCIIIPANKVAAEQQRQDAVARLQVQQQAELDANIKLVVANLRNLGSVTKTDDACAGCGVQTQRARKAFARAVTLGLIQNSGTKARPVFVVPQGEGEERKNQREGRDVVPSPSGRRRRQRLDDVGRRPDDAPQNTKQETAA